ncbi:acyl-CoA dehydrogenase [Prauserella endophytica]|uniref:Acyl-CoA dehydrogenase n=1 Tax=Prauserella endophytica TaxID=1592324 RepID=A0ABY2RU26_9PSEU|nr:acyl-CoA dehydrogenase [Prauserella endophytica]TKG60514.1 acyl-CoA dehydrogenase [Prauserella endophytica]
MNGDALEELLGDPYDGSNPTGHAAIVAADDAGEPCAAGEAVLDAWQANAEYVPAELGGRLTAVDELVRRLRPVFRRDAGLGLGHGLTTLMASLNVWAAGTAEQRKHLAGRLLAGERVSVAYHELEHGNDLTRNALRAERRGNGFVLDGTKRVINNAGRARAAVVFARTADPAAAPGGRDHSLLFVDDLDRVPGLTRLPRLRTSGLAGCLLAGFGFDGAVVGEDALVGAVGTGAETALRSFQVSRCVTAGVGTSLLEGALFGVYRFATERVLYGRPVTAIPHARSVLAGAFIDLQVAQALARVAARALHLYPSVAGRYAAAAKYLAPKITENALADLAVVLGARGYLREGEYAFVGKHLRDIAGLSIGHAGGVSCQLTVLPDLPGVRPTGAEGALFDDSPLPELDLGELRVRAGRADPLLGALEGVADDELRAELASVRADAAALPVTERGVTASHRSLALTERYAWLLAASACLNSPRAADPQWTDAVLERIGLRSGRTTERTSTAALDAAYQDMADRAATGRSFDLDPEPVLRALA